MRRGWSLLLAVLFVALQALGGVGARRRPRFASSPTSGALRLDALELLAQIADGPADDGRLTCFTCTNVTDNDHCNRYAIDRPCEPGLSLCRTEHVIERLPAPGGAGGFRPRSVRLTKTCVAASECTRNAVGCRGVAGESTYLRVCTSCCDWSYCNELAPADTLTAVLALSRGGADSVKTQHLALQLTFILAVISSVF